MAVGFFFNKLTNSILATVIPCSVVSNDIENVKCSCTFAAATFQARRPLRLNRQTVCETSRLCIPKVEELSCAELEVEVLHVE